MLRQQKFQQIDSKVGVSVGSYALTEASPSSRNQCLSPDKPEKISNHGPETPSSNEIRALDTRDGEEMIHCLYSDL